MEMTGTRESQQEVTHLRQQIETFYQVNKFINSIDNLPVLLDLVMQEAETAVQRLVDLAPDNPGSLQLAKVIRARRQVAAAATTGG